ncbi:MAG: PSD1 and planctomycete cytochrome C domain-containing protein [Gemmataceae bacterium]|nr:PSD1 and planctomycete cytochrome C domain-containing protein [Gemmataceae bacterium]
MPPTRLALLAALVLPASGFAAEPVDYRRDVKPVLQERCYACHGALKQNAKLRVDSGAGMVKAGVVVPGKPDESELIARVSAADADVRMPPEGHPLKPEQVAKLRAWVEQGAKVPADDRPEPDPRDHWSFRPPVRPPLPTNTRNPIDAFVAAEWQKRGLKPVGFADKRLLLRRVYLDLIGLPPTAEQYDAFVKDTAPDAYDKVVTQLLASPQYGERWGRHFLDVWRYSDWWGLGAELRNSQKHIWHWRDWTVESVNADVGYDELLRQMLAADELYPTDWNKLRATGYLARPYFLFNRTTWLDEVVEHTGKGLLGLTLNCTKCHDHKYDPISQANYYQFRAVFEPYQVRTDFVPGVLDPEQDGIPRAFDCNLDAKTPFHVRGDERNPDPARTIAPGLPAFLAPNGLDIRPVKLPLHAHQPGMRPEIVATYRKQAEAKRASVKDAAAKADAAVAARPEWHRSAVRFAADKQVAAAEAELAMVKKAEANPNDPALALRGAVKAKESNLEADASRLKPFPDTSTGRRSALARWLTDRQNPLAARVAVNHVWLRHIGQPLVPTVFDFGRKGTPPTHPELLDWLAVEFMEHGWSLKRLHRLIVTSDVYRLSSSAKDAGENVRLDPENRYLWRANPQRMQAQVVRDGLLHLAGDLDPAAGGPPVPLAAQDASRRRSLYFFHSHNEHNKLLGIFDDANVLECYRRTESIVPQQALALSNSRFAQTTAGKINDRLHARLGDVNDAKFVTAAFELILGGAPTADELRACEEALAELRAALPEADRTKRARLQVVAALVNHNDFVTVR